MSRSLITLLAALALILLAAETASALTRVKITAPSHRPNAEIICPWVTASSKPGTPPGHYTLGVCPPQGTPR